MSKRVVSSVLAVAIGVMSSCAVLADTVDLEKIREEVEEAKKTFRKYKWPTIDVTRKSVEETAASIIKIYEIYKQNG